MAGGDGGDFDGLIGGDFDLPALRLHLNLALGGDELQGLFERGLGAGDEQADGFANVVDPPSSSGLVGVALRDLVEVGAGGDGCAVGRGDGDAGGCADADDGLAAGLVLVPGLAFFIGIAALLQAFYRLDQVILMPALALAARCFIGGDGLIVFAGLGQVGELVRGMFA